MGPWRAYPRLARKLSVVKRTLVGRRTVAVGLDGAGRSWILAGGRIACLGLENDACRVATRMAAGRTWKVAVRRCTDLVWAWLTAEPVGQVIERKTGTVRIDVD